MRLPPRGRAFEWITAGLLLGAIVIFAVVVNGHYPIDQWLFWHYAAYWLATTAVVVSAFGLGAISLRVVRLTSLPTLEFATFAFAIGLYEYELAMFLAGACHLYNPALFFALPLAAIVLTQADLKQLGKRMLRRTRLLRRQTGPLGPVGLLALAFGFVALLAVYFLILSPENVQFDSRWKHLALAEDYVAHGGIRRLREGWVFDSRPHFTSYLFSWAFLLPKSRLFDRMVLSAHLEFATFLVTTLIGIPALVRRLIPRADPRVVWAARFLFPGVLLYDSSLAVGADHFGAMYGVPIFLATLFAWRKLELRWCALLGLLLAAAAMVKETTALLLAPAPVLAIGFRMVQLLVIRRRAAWTARWDAVSGPLLATAVGLVCSAPLWLTNVIWHGDPIYPILNKYLHERPWTSQSAYRLKWAYEDANMWQPPHNFAGFLTSLKTLATFSFVPNDWPRFHGSSPVFGSLFTLLLPGLIFARVRGRVWWLILWVHFSILCWFWVHHQDRYLQGVMPLMTAATVVAIIAIWRMGILTRVALSALIALQVVWGGDVYFFQTHAMAKSPLKKSIDLLSAGFERDYTERFNVQGGFQSAGALLPKHARVVVHDENSHLGLNAESIIDRFPFEYGISYGQQATPRDLYELYRDLGATHILWRRKSMGTDSLAGDIMFFDFVMHHTTDLGSPGGRHLSQMPDRAPSGPFNDTVAVFSCPAGSYPAGLYRVRDLQVPVYGPASHHFPSAPPRPLPDDWQSTLATMTQIVATESRCFKAERSLKRLGFSEAVARSRPGGTRGQLYSIWFARKD